MNRKEATLQTLSKLNSTRVPVLASGSLELIKSLDDENVDFVELARILESCPSIAARLIALANSAWSAPIVTVTSLQTACSRLGIKVVRSTSVALSVADLFNPRQCTRFDPQRFWTDAFLTAETTEWLAPLARVEPATDVPSARTAGLLHNIGLLWLADQLPEQINSALQITLADTQCRLAEVLRRLLGFDHAEAACHLLRQWRLPASLTEPIGKYPESGYTGEFWTLTNLVGVAVELVAMERRGQAFSSEDPRALRLALPFDALSNVSQRIQKKRPEVEEMAASLFGQ